MWRPRLFPAVVFRELPLPQMLQTGDSQENEFEVSERFGISLRSLRGLPRRDTSKVEQELNKIARRRDQRASLRRLILEDLGA